MFTNFDVVNAPRTAAFKAYKRAAKFDLFWVERDPAAKLDFYVEHALELRDLFLAVPDYSAYKERFYENLLTGWDIRTSARAAEFKDYFLPRARYVGLY